MPRTTVDMQVGEPAIARRIAYLDGWRGVAILMVLADHFLGAAGLGRYGVELFFVLSGLLISKILFDQQIPLSVFYVRRVARIFPAFYGYLACIALVVSFWPGPFPADDFVYSALFLRTYVPDANVWTLEFPIGQLWSLNVEEHCYVFMSIVAIAARRTSPRTARFFLTAATLMCALFYALYRYEILRTASDTPTSLRTECAGFAVLASASIHLWMKDFGIRPSLTWFALAAAAAAMGMVATLSGAVTRGTWAMAYLAVPLCLAVMLNNLSAAPCFLKAALSTQWLCWLGLCSFSIYLWQEAIWFLGRGDRFGVPLPSWLVVVLVVAVASYYGLEQPMRRYINRLGGQSN